MPERATATDRPRWLTFVKMHGLGNDFLVFDGARFFPDPALLRRLADRHTGIGFDQALVVLPPPTAWTDLHYRVFNADGSEAGQCGNGARCVAAYAAERLPGRPRRLRLGSPSGAVEAEIRADGQVAVGLPVPDFAPASLPFLAEAGEEYALTPVGATASVTFGAVSIGNPHAVIRVPDVATAPVAVLGPRLGNDPAFPRRTNVGFLEVRDPTRVRLRVHERGVGETRACGTGACAAVVVGRQRGWLGPAVEVELPGGTVHVEWAGPGQRVWLMGPAETVFEGRLAL